MGNEINRKLCQKLKFAHADKLYIHKPKTVQENGIHKINWNFEIQTRHPILARTPSVNNNKKTCSLVDFTILEDRKEIKESEKIYKHLDLAGEQKKLWNMKVIPIVVDARRRVPIDQEKKLGELKQTSVKDYQLTLGKNSQEM